MRGNFKGFSFFYTIKLLQMGKLSNAFVAKDVLMTKCWWVHQSFTHKVVVQILKLMHEFKHEKKTLSWYKWML